MNNNQLRQEAVSRYLKGEKVSHIAVSLKRSRKWVHHWINRFKNADGSNEWFISESRAPKKSRCIKDTETEHHILCIRQDLSSEKMAQTGAISIQYEFERRGIKPVPAVWTINRVIRKHGLNEKTRVQKTPQDYPELFVHTHQMDLVGPRFIKGDGRYYSVNLIDTTTRSCFVKAVRTKSSHEIVQAIASFWRTHGMPDALQMDNELPFRGSNRYPRSFGSVVRFALSQGVAPVFIPPGEPWRNGIIEKFNGTYQQKFLRAYTFESFEKLCLQEQSFIDFHNTHHRYSSQKHKTPNEMKALTLPALYYTGLQHLPTLKEKMKVKINLTQGCIYFIRYIRSDLKLHLTNESFKVQDDLKYSYVIAEVDIENQCINIRQNEELRQVIPFIMPAVDW